MKKRIGYIGNSSSSSFICDICWEAEEIDNSDIFECVNGHEYARYCLQDVLNSEDRKAIENDDLYTIPAEICPCCRLKVTAWKDVQELLVKFAGMNLREISELLKQNAKSFTEKNTFIKSLNPENINMIKKQLNNIEDIPPPSGEFNLRAHL